MIQFPEHVTTPTRELLTSINNFLVDLFEADKERGAERITAFVGLVDKHEMFSVSDAVRFATQPVDKSFGEA